MSQAAGYPVERIADSPTCGPGIVAIIVAAVFGSLLWLTVGFQVLVSVPQYEKDFGDYRMKLPLLTEWIIRDAWWIAPACFLGVVLLCINRRSRWAGIILLVVVPVIINLIMIVGTYYPYAAMVKALGGNAPQ